MHNLAQAPEALLSAEWHLQRCRGDRHRAPGTATFPAVSGPLDQSLTQTELKLELGGRYSLIDAADPGSALTAGCLSIALESGTFRVTSGRIDSGPDVRLIVHRLARE